MGQQFNPPHPGEVLRDGVFAETGITITESRASATTYTNHRRNMRCVSVFNNSIGRVHSCTVQILRCINAPYDIAGRRMARGHPVDVGSQGMCCWEPACKRLVAKVLSDVAITTVTPIRRATCSGAIKLGTK